MPSPRRDEKKLATLRRYLKRKRTVDQITKKLGVPQRTVYRYLNYLRDSGMRLLTEKDRNQSPPKIYYKEG